MWEDNSDTLEIHQYLHILGRVLQILASSLSCIIFLRQDCRGATASKGVGMRAQGKQRAHENYKAGRVRE